MLTILLGEDIYLKQSFLDQRLAQTKGELVKYYSSDVLPQLGVLSATNLFKKNQIHVFIKCLAQYELADLELAHSLSTEVYFIEDSIDKRLKINQELIAFATIKDFAAPTAERASKWIMNMARVMEINIQPTAVNELTRRLMGDTKKTLPVLMAQNEILKLASYAGSAIITKEMVEELTPYDININVFTLLDQFGRQNKKRVIEMLQRYYESSSEDEKILTIRLIGLLSDQLRNLLITQELLLQKFSETDILQLTGWKSARLFIMKKISQNFSSKQLTLALAKFYNLDKELKSSNIPTRVVIDMIVAAL